MPEEKMPAEDEMAAEELVQNIGQALANGTPPQKIIDGLVDSGMPANDAHAIVSNVAQHMQAGHRSGSSVPSWLYWIGGLILINVLSYLFNWGFWLW